MRKRKRKIIGVISGVILGFGVLGGVIALTSHFMKKGEVSIHPTYEVGGLDANGKYEEDKSTLYTKDKFACEGLKAVLDFDAQIDYQIFYYDILDNFISSTDVLNMGYSGDAPLNGAYARIEITPTNDEDGKISWTEKLKYANQLNLKVTKSAESNVSRKFTSINGFCVQVVNNVIDSVFEYGYHWSSSSLELMEGSSNSACTARTLLAVEGGYIISVDYDKLTLDENQNFTLIICEFNELPTSSSKFTTNNISRVDGKDEIVLEKDTKYVLFTVWLGDHLKENCENFPKAISVQKAK